MHLKRQKTSKAWPIARKGTKYVVVPSHNKKNGIPLLIILRDMLKIASNRKEACKILSSGSIFVNGKIRKKENFSVALFDILKISDKNYELALSEKGRFVLQDAGKKALTLKIIGKKILKNKKVQLNLLYGKNIVTNEKANIGDSAVFEGNKISTIIAFEKGKEAIVFAGKYKGRIGKIDKIEGKMAVISDKNEKINVRADSLMAIK